EGGSRISRNPCGQDIYAGERAHVIPEDDRTRFNCLELRGTDDGSLAVSTGAYEEQLPAFEHRSSRLLDLLRSVGKFMRPEFTPIVERINGSRIFTGRGNPTRWCLGRHLLSVCLQGICDIRERRITGDVT